MRSALPRSTRFRIAALAGAIHLGLQGAVYVLGFAVGPEGTGRELLGVSLYEVAEVLTFPFVPLAEALRWTTLGILAFPLNSIAWAVVVYLALGVAARLLHPRDRPPPLAGSG